MLIDMKRVFLVMTCLAALAGLPACDQVKAIEAVEEGSGTILVRNGDEAATKASTTAETYESQVNNVQLFIFDASGDIVKYGSAASSSVTIGKVPVGTYTLAVVVNNPTILATTATLSALRTTTMNLGSNSTTASSGFLMYGEKASVAVTVAGKSETVAVTRFPARIRLVGVTNGVTYGAQTVVAKSAMLVNGLGTWNYGASGAAAGNVNAAGEKSGSIITAAAGADYAALTFSDLGNTSVTSSGTSFNRRFYSFPKAAVSPDKTGSTAGGNVRLSVLATVNGTDYWYPVTLAGIERNQCYDVTLTITGPGSSHPNEPVVSGNVTATVNVTGWGDGSDYNETI